MQMNERIKQLADQCMVEVKNVPIKGMDGWTSLETVRQIDPEKFAELIVKDICDMVNKHIQWNNPNDCPLVLDIKERYGVEWWTTPLHFLIISVPLLLLLQLRFPLFRFSSLCKLKGNIMTIRSEIERKLSLIDQLKAEAKALREAAKAEAAETAVRRKAAIREARQLMRQFKIEAADLASA
jgi:hypothetical protein